MDNKFLPAIMMFSLSVACVACIVIGLANVLPKTPFTKPRRQRILTFTIVAIAAWMSITGWLAVQGFFAHFTSIPPRPLLLIIVPLPVILLVIFSKTFADILKVVPPQWLIGMQAFRILVEFLLLKAYLNNLLPKQMTFEGWNFDVVSGLLAIPVAIIISKKTNRALVKWYNIIGLLLLLNILTIAVLSMPTPLRQFINEPANTIIAKFPFVYLPGVLVVIAYSLHIFSLQQLKVNRQYKPGAGNADRSY